MKKLNGFVFETSEARQAAAEAHPLWVPFITWDLRHHSGPHVMDDDHDRETFEAFVAGYLMASEQAAAAPIPNGQQKVAEGVKET